MDVEDLSHNRVVGGLTKLIEALGHTRSPLETLDAIRRGFADVYGPVASITLSTRGLADGEYRVTRILLSGEPLDTPIDTSLQTRRGGVIGEIINRRRPQLIQNVDWSVDAMYGESLREFRSVIAMPLGGERSPISWVILLKRDPERFTRAEMEETLLRGALVGALMESQEISAELERAYERIDSDLRQVAELQSSLLPDPLPNIPGLEVAVSYEPSGRAGGDLYDLFCLDAERGPEGSWCIFLGDASGHGSAAAVVMAMMQSILHAHPAQMEEPQQLLMYANQQLCAKKIGGFVTAFLGIYTPATRRLSYSSAGHPPPLRRTAANGRVSFLDGASTYPIGIDEFEEMKMASTQLQLGDTLVLFTDGITEARDSRGELYGTERLRRVIEGESHRPQVLIDQLRRDVRSFEQSPRPVDDQTMVCIRNVR